MYRRGWQMLRDDWLVFIWKLLADFAARLTGLAVGLVVLTLVIADFMQFSVGNVSILAWFDHLGAILQSPQFIAGIVGATVFANLVGVAIQAFVVGGVWGVLNRGLEGEPIAMLKTFFGQAFEQFADVMALFALRFALGIVASLLGISIAIGVVHGLTTGDLAAMTGWQSTLLLSVGLTIYIAWVALTRLVIEIAGAPLIIDDVDPGEALLRGANFVIENFWNLYRLIIFAVGLLLIPLGAYWVLIMFDNLAVLWPALEPLRPVTSLLLLVGQLLVYLSTTVVGLLFYGALFAFYRCDDDAYAETGLPGTPSSDAPSGGTSTDSEDAVDTDIQLSDMVPDDAPHRYSSAELLDGEPPAGDAVDNRENGEKKHSSEKFSAETASKSQVDDPAFDGDDRGIESGEDPGDGKSGQRPDNRKDTGPDGNPEDSERRD